MNMRVRNFLTPCLGLLFVVLAPSAEASQQARPTGRLLDLLDNATRQAAADPHARERSGVMTELVSNWNPQACGFTDTAILRLSRPTRLARLDLWYNWTAREGSTTYEIVARSGAIVGRGTLSRDSCDPYQAAWCVGTASPRIDLPAGAYAIRTPSARICQNPGSGGEGFIKAWGGSARN